MESEQPVEKAASPAEAKPASPGMRVNDRRGRDSRRPRFRGRDDRGRGDERSRGDDRGERPRGPDEGSGRRPPGGIREVMQHVEHIRNELRKVLDEMHEVTRMLEQAEREKTISEDELDQLRDSLRHIQSDRGPARYPRNPEPRNPERRPPPAQEAAPAAEEEPEREID